VSSPARVETVRRKNESDERLIRRFIKKVKKDGILELARERRYYEKPSVKKNRLKNRKRKEAKKQNR